MKSRNWNFEFEISKYFVLIFDNKSSIFRYNCYNLTNIKNINQKIYTEIFRNILWSLLLSICRFLKSTFFSHFQICIYTNYIIFSLFWGLFYPTRRLGLSTVSRNPKNLQNMKNFVKKMNFSYFFFEQKLSNQACVHLSFFFFIKKSYPNIFASWKNTTFFYLTFIFTTEKPESKMNFPGFCVTSGFIGRSNEKLIFWSKIVILVKNCYFGQKLLFWSKIFILVKNFYFGQKS